MNGIAAPIIASEPLETAEALPSRRSVSVIMVVYMTGEALQQSVECVLADPLVDELVVVDNGSTRLEAARLKRLA
ncbi:MAG: glycosyltransferase family 2 protein, partial [Phenylobacterium sp.]